MMPTLTTAASDPGRGSARDPLLFLRWQILPCPVVSRVCSRRRITAWRARRAPPRRADGESRMRQWNDAGGDVLLS